VYTRLGIAGRPPHFVAEFYPYAGLVQTIRLRRDTVHVRFSDLLRGASPDVWESAAALLLARLYRQRLPAGLGRPYQDFAARQSTRRRVQRLRRARARRKALNPQGKFFHLQPVFAALNSRYFGGSLAAPQLGWSERPWRAQLGCFDPALHQIVLSSRLDREGVPHYAVEYVMFHEMLHMKHPIRRAACGLQSHSPKFRAEEKRYHDYERARRYFKRRT
jgi:hypothetical protein